MDTITHEVRLLNWKAVIEQCQSRPKGQTIVSWCEENGISVKQYYYWQRRVRRKAVQEAPAALLPSSPREEAQVSFAEISFPQKTQASSCAAPDPVPDFHPEAVIRKGDLVIGLHNNISDRLLDRILKGVCNAV